MKADVATLQFTLDYSGIEAYTIPQYQRPYTWDKDNYEVLWGDLSDAYATYIKALEEKRIPDSYFLGPVVFVKNRDKRSFDIIDGQQRTTTIHILLWYLFKKLTDFKEKGLIQRIITFLDSESKLKVSARDVATFLEIRTSDGQIEGKSKMHECANYFRAKVNELSNPNSFSVFLREYTQFIMIIADDYGKAWDLFIGLNGKGEPLNPTDLVKAYVCGHSNIGEETGQIWEEKILRLKSDSTAYLLFLTRYKLKKYVTEASLFREIASKYPRDITVNDISENSDIFYLFWHIDIDSIPQYFSDKINISSDSKKALRVLRDLGRRDFTSLLFQYVAAFGKKSIFEEEFLRMLASYQIRLAILRIRVKDRKFIAWFSDIDFNKAEENDPKDNNEAIKVKKQRAMALIFRTLRGDAPDDSTFASEVMKGGYESNYPARIILKHHEEGDRGTKTISDYQLEHLMPITGTDFWYNEAGVIDKKGAIDKESYERVVNNIGNLFVIDPKTNNEVKNKEYSIKKAFYKKHLKDWSIARVTAKKSKWKRKDISERAKEIAEWAKVYWSLNE